MRPAVAFRKITAAPSRIPALARYGVAVASICVALLLRVLFEKFIGEEIPLLLLFTAVLLSAGFGGLGPGLTATLLGAIASYFRGTPPHFDFSMSDPQQTVRLVRFLIEGLFISALGTVLQAARRRAEESEAQARRLEQEILDISDDERRRIGQDLHDGLGQHLTGVAFLSKALEQRLINQSSPETEQATQIVKLVSQSIGQTRALARGLAPIGLEDGGLPAALNQLAATTTSVFGMECACACSETSDVEDIAQAIHLYRIAQEAVNNAVRHAQATRIDIALMGSNGNVILQIEDNGTGINRAEGREGMGLQIMSFRARMIGGSLAIGRRETGGTSVTCTVPIEHR